MAHRFVAPRFKYHCCLHAANCTMLVGDDQEMGRGVGNGLALVV